MKSLNEQFSKDWAIAQAVKLTLNELLASNSSLPWHHFVIQLINLAEISYTKAVVKTLHILQRLGRTKLSTLLEMLSEQDVVLETPRLVELILDMGRADLLNIDLSLQEISQTIDLGDEINTLLSRIRNKIPQLGAPKVKQVFLKGKQRLPVNKRLLRKQNSIALSIAEKTFRNWQQNKDLCPEGADKRVHSDWLFLVDTLSQEYLARGNKFYIENQYDRRGRWYSTGYSHSTQGRESQKALLELSNKECLNNTSSFGFNQKPEDYLASDIASFLGFDKYDFETRSLFVELHVMPKLSLETPELIQELQNEFGATKYPNRLFSALEALKDALEGNPIGYMISLDSMCSGIQIMATLSGDLHALECTGATTDYPKTDAYRAIAEAISPDTSRDEAKSAVMPYCYGSNKCPEEVFGDLDIFENAFSKAFPNVWEVREVLKDSWNVQEVNHSWQLPDGHWADIPVVSKVQQTIKLKHNLEITLNTKVPGSWEYRVSNMANVIHSIDAYVAREVVMRTTIKPHEYQRMLNLLAHHIEPENPIDRDILSIGWLITQTPTSLKISNMQAEAFKDLLKECEAYGEFETVVVHDCFMTHPNNGSAIRHAYRSVLLALSQSNLLNEVIAQLSPMKEKANQFVRDNELEDVMALIEQSQYLIN